LNVPTLALSYLHILQVVVLVVMGIVLLDIYIQEKVQYIEKGTI